MKWKYFKFEHTYMFTHTQSIYIYDKFYGLSYLTAFSVYSAILKTMGPKLNIDWYLYSG